MRTPILKIAYTMLCAAVLFATAGCADANTNNNNDANTTAITAIADMTTSEVESSETEAVETKPVETEAVKTEAVEATALTTGTSHAVTTPSTSTTVTEPAVQNKLKYHAYNAGLDMNSTLHLGHSNDIFTVSDNTTWYFFDFDTVQAIGRTHDNLVCYAFGYACSMRADITDNRTLTVKAGPTMMKNITCTNIAIAYENASETLTYTVIDRKNHPGDKILTADLYDVCYRNGIYRITATYDAVVGTTTNTLYLYVNCASNDPTDYEFYICYGEDHCVSDSFDPMVRNNAINEFIKNEGITPDNALTASRHYPQSAPIDNDDSQYWIDLAHELIKGYEKEATAAKAMILHDWITSHLKYDYYKVNVLHYQRYYTDNGTKLDTNQYVSKNYTGVCLDFSSIYAIMCREVGVPCIVLNDDTHAWNAIYFTDRNKWVEIDLTVDVNRGVDGENTDIVSGDKLYDYS